MKKLNRYTLLSSPARAKFSGELMLVAAEMPLWHTKKLFFAEASCVSHILIKPSVEVDINFRFLVGT